MSQEDPECIESSGVDTTLIVSDEAAKEENVQTKLIAEDLAGVQIWDRNFTTPIWDREAVLAVPNIYQTKYFSKIREFINFLVYKSTPQVHSAA